VKALRILLIATGIFSAITGLLMFAIDEAETGIIMILAGALFVFALPRLLIPNEARQNAARMQAGRAAVQVGSALERMQAYAEAHPTEKQLIAKRKAEARAQGIACCPKCGSTSLSANKKGFGAGKAVAGMVVTGGVGGAVFGAAGSGKVVVTCLNCGHRFKPGQK